METLERLIQNPRVTVRRAGPPHPDGRCVVYWMQRAQRAIDNPALDVAIEAANALGKPAVAFLSLISDYPNANLRHYAFLVQGLFDTAERLARRGIGFVIRRSPDHHLAKFCAEVRACLVVGDENPMREPERWRQALAQELRLPLWTVDSDVIVPSKLLEKEQYAARTIRPRLRAYLGQFLRSVSNVRPHVAWKRARELQSCAPDVDLLEDFPVDRSVGPVSGFRGGTTEAAKLLTRFVRERLRGYALRRNHPELDGTSRLSPYLHFGHIGAHTVALAVKNAGAPTPDREAFLEELIVRRELAVNFVRFNSRYDRLACAEPWALRTLRQHSRDERTHLYTERQLENAETHDPLWNAAQRQMMLTGWMHGYLRMYWAKKILEWTRSPEEGFDIAVRLNDRYELDGRDPNGYAGVAWAIGGKHDRAWGPERPVYGKIRYMSYASTSRKFDSKAYMSRISALAPKGVTQ